MSKRRKFFKPIDRPPGRQRRVRQFGHEIAGRQLQTNYVGADDDLTGHPHRKLIVGAIKFYCAGCHGTDASKACIVCHASFSKTQPAAFLVSFITGATSAAVAGVCPTCWLTQSIENFDRAATHVLRRLLPTGRFIDPHPGVRPC